MLGCPLIAQKSEIAGIERPASHMARLTIRASASSRAR
jgi:hypothetical protein